MATATANSGGNGYTLRERLEQLPPEIWKMIYEFTFTADAKIRVYGPKYPHGNKTTRAWFVEVSKGYPEEMVTFNEIPHLLHVDRASSKKFAESFYGNPDSHFLVPMNSFSRIETHLKLAKNLHMVVDGSPSEFYNRCWRLYKAELIGRSKQSIAFISAVGIQALLKKRAGIANSPCA